MYFILDVLGVTRFRTPFVRIDHMYIDLTHVDQLITASIYKPYILVIYVYLWYIEFVSAILSKICSLEIEMENTNI